jgi:hypothetical protein
MYMSGDPFLYFLACLVDANPTAPELQSLVEPIVTAPREFVGRPGNSFAVAARVLACQKFGVWCQSDVQYLKELQEVDRGWEIGCVCRNGRSQKKLGDLGVATAWATKALEQDKYYTGGNIDIKGSEEQWGVLRMIWIPGLMY